MNLKTRRRILGLARFLERRAKGLRAYAKRKTPRRPRRAVTILAAPDKEDK